MKGFLNLVGTFNYPTSDMRIREALRFLDENRYVIFLDEPVSIWAPYALEVYELREVVPIDLSGHPQIYYQSLRTLTRKEHGELIHKLYQHPFELYLEQVRSKNQYYWVHLFKGGATMVDPKVLKDIAPHAYL